MLILGSRSPRRKEILSHFSLPFKQVSSSFDEASVAFDGDPEKYVIDIAKGKANALDFENPILTADTLVFYEGDAFGIPQNVDEARAILKTLRGNWHEVYTGVVLKDGKNTYETFEKTRVQLNALTDDQLEKYLAHNTWSDKAGGYAIQRTGGLIVQKIEGCFYNVMGFPINAVYSLFQNIGVDLWDYLDHS